MKTINNVQKNLFAALFILSGLFIINTASAAGKNSASTETAGRSLMIETATEAPLTVENWMTNETFFTAGSLVENATEGTLGIESWMLDENNFSSLAEALAPATEAAMEIESWMTEESHFTQKINDEKTAKGVEVWDVAANKYGKRIFILTQVKDDVMPVENWMLRNYYWR